jgi:SAM-dependent methyltransferase
MSRGQLGDKAFEFGQNWQAFLDRAFSEERLQAAIESIVSFSGLETLEGLSFLDIGCGSGLFSLAAHRLGADRIVSLDVDPKSVWCADMLKKMAGSPHNWQVYEGSVLDDGFMENLGRFDFVYSWGVLHHTGEMWRAIVNGSRAVAEGGLFYLAIYNRTDALGIFPDCRFGPSKAWVPIKKIYASLAVPLQNLIDYAIMAFIFTLYLLTFKNPFKRITTHKDNFRGMSWRHDIKDWVGGYPYEYSGADEVFVFLRDRGFKLENLKCYQGVGNNEYLFQKIRAQGK